MSFYLIHHPVIIGIAYYIVQWEVSTAIKILSVIICSFVITLGIFELLIKRINILGNFFGVKGDTK